MQRRFATLHSDYSTALRALASRSPKHREAFSLSPFRPLIRFLTPRRKAHFRAAAFAAPHPQAKQQKTARPNDLAARVLSFRCLQSRKAQRRAHYARIKRRTQRPAKFFQ